MPPISMPLAGRVRIALAVVTLALPAFAQSAAPAPDPSPSARELLLELCESTRLAGTRGSQAAAEKVAARLRQAGFEAEIEAREVLLSYPRKLELELLHAGETLALRIERFDPDAIPAGDVPMYNAWSHSGEVRAPLVDAGRGLRADFERLQRAGVDVRGKIALVRYGGSYRGIKVDLASQFGCVGVLLFSDPKSDGATRGATWPQGPWKQPHEAQRGSISPMGRTPGDPSTPGWPSPKPGEVARRLEGAALDEALPTIPCIPIGAAEAEQILSRLARVQATSKSGNADAEALGPGPIEARLLLDTPRELRTIYNVIGRLRGASEDCVIAGNHRDAWVRGANDAGSGTVALLRAAFELGRRARAGWKPAHSIWLCFWDAEEFGLIGSTEWGEAHAPWLERHALAYLNLDVGVSGTRFQGASGTPGLLGTLKDVLARVPTPSAGSDAGPANLWQDWCASLQSGAPALSLPGSGSDFAVFLHHLSLPVLDLGLSGNSAGQYHTSFDDVAIVERYLDPGYVGHALCAELLTELLSEIAARGRASFDGDEAALALAQVARKAGEELDPRGAAWLGTERAERIAAAFEALAQESAPNPSLYAELSMPGGIPGRGWYANPIWTPGLEDGYGSETFPILRAAAKESAAALDAALETLLARIASARSQHEPAGAGR